MGKNSGKERGPNMGKYLGVNHQKILGHPPNPRPKPPWSTGEIRRKEPLNGESTGHNFAQEFPQLFWISLEVSPTNSPVDIQIVCGLLPLFSASCSIFHLNPPPPNDDPPKSHFDVIWEKKEKKKSMRNPVHGKKVHGKEKSMRTMSNAQCAVCAHEEH